MKTLIAYCGLDCATCSAYIATQKNDNNERKKVAEEWSKTYNANIKPEDINCDGCTSDSTRLFNYPKECKIRKCGIEKGVENCAGCSEYACNQLKEFFKMVPSAETTLNKIRKQNS